MAKFWIDPNHAMGVEDVGFLVEITDNNLGSNRYEVWSAPAHTNMSREPLLYGWCGSWNNRATEACGMVRVIREAKNGRLLVQELEGADLAAELEKAGYPDLAPSEDDAPVS